MNRIGELLSAARAIGRPTGFNPRVVISEALEAAIWLGAETPHGTPAPTNVEASENFDQLLAAAGAALTAAANALDYYSLKAAIMHRRAQSAEADAMRAIRSISRLENQLRHQVNREKKQRKRANRLGRWADVAAYQLRENEHLRGEHDPLARIIALGRRFP